MLPHLKFLRLAGIYLVPCVVLAAVAACSSPATPAPTPIVSAPSSPTPTPAAVITPPPLAAPAQAAGKFVPYNEFADLQYYLVKDTNTVALEFYDGSGTLIVDIQGDLQTGDPAPALHIHILGNKTGPETDKFVWNTEGNAIFYFDVGAGDKSTLRVIYEDDQGPHAVPAAGIVDKLFEVEHRTPLKATVQAPQ